MAAAASTSIPPAVEVTAIAAASVPYVFTTRISSSPAFALVATLTYASAPALPKVRSKSSGVVILTALSPAVISSALIALAETPVIPEPSPVKALAARVPATVIVDELGVA